MRPLNNRKAIAMAVKSTVVALQNQALTFEERRLLTKELNQLLKASEKAARAAKAEERKQKVAAAPAPAPAPAPKPQETAAEAEARMKEFLARRAEDPARKEMLERETRDRKAREEAERLK